jgi:twinkle protein
VPTPYDIAGAAHWRNKADNCITVYRNPEDVDVHVQKIRVKEVGKIGVAKFKYKVGTGEYFPINY